MRGLPVITRLPVRMYREIGKIAFQYALYEYRLMRTCYLLLDISPKQGRIAVREPRGTDILDMIQDLMTLRGLQSTFDFDAARQLTEAINSERDKLAHGVWMRESGRPHYLLFNTRGSWQPDPRQRGKVKRRLKPEGLHYDLGHLQQHAKQATELARFADHLNRAIVSAVSRQRRALRSALRDQILDRTHKKRARQL